MLSISLILRFKALLSDARPIHLAKYRSARALSSMNRLARAEALHFHAWLHAGYRPALRQKLLTELNHYTRGSAEDDASEPAERNGLYVYRAARPEGADNVVHYRTWAPPDASPQQQGVEHVVLDMNAVAAETGYACLGVLRPSLDPEQRHLVYTVDTTGEEKYEGRVVRLPAGGEAGPEGGTHPLRVCIPGAVGATWAPYIPGAPPTLYYTRAHAETRRTHQVWQHTLGTDTAEDVLLWQEDRPGRYVDVSTSKDGLLCFVTSTDRDSNDVYWLSCHPLAMADRGEGLVTLFSRHTGTRSAPPVPILCTSTSPPVQYFAEHLGHGWVLLVNTAGGAIDYQLSAVHMSQLLVSSSDMRTHWSIQCCDPAQLHPLPLQPKPVPPSAHTQAEAQGEGGGEAGLVIEDVDVFAGSGAGLTAQDGHVVVYCRLHGVPQVRVLRLGLASTHPSRPEGTYTAGRISSPRQEVHVIPLQQEGRPVSSIIPASNPDPASPLLRFSVATSTCPPVDYLYDVRTQQLTVARARNIGPVPSRPLFHAADYTSYTIHAPSLDGTLIPVTLVHATVPSAVQAVQEQSGEGQAERAWVPPNAEQVQERAAQVADACLTWLRSPEGSAQTSALAEAWRRGDPSAVQGEHGTRHGHAPRAGAALPPLVQACLGRDDWRALKHAQGASQHAGILRRVFGVWSGAATPRPARGYPCLLQAYGAYGQLQETDFSPRRLPLLSRGWVLAFPSVRGGGEGGRLWYQAGRGSSKLTSMVDTVAALRMLLATGVTSADVLAMKTASAGCLLSSWLCNTHPGLVRAHILASPFLDPFHAMMKEDAPLTASEYSEWGNPAASMADREYLQSYSPLTQLPAALRRASAWQPDQQGQQEGTSAGSDAGRLEGKWPAQLITCSLEDPRTPAADALRYVDAVRQWGGVLAAAGQGADGGGVAGAPRKRKRPGFAPPEHVSQAVEAQDPLLLCNVLDSGGHFGAAGRTAGLQEAALEVLFLHRALGLHL